MAYPKHDPAFAVYKKASVPAAKKVQAEKEPTWREKIEAREDYFNDKVGWIQLKNLLLRDIDDLAAEFEKIEAGEYEEDDEEDEADEFDEEDQFDEDSEVDEEIEDVGPVEFEKIYDECDGFKDGFFIVGNKRVLLVAELHKYSKHQDQAVKLGGIIQWANAPGEGIRGQSRSDEEAALRFICEHSLRMLGGKVDLNDHFTATWNDFYFRGNTYLTIEPKTFPKFKKLPPELQLMIWKLAPSERVIRVISNDLMSSKVQPDGSVRDWRNYRGQSREPSIKPQQLGMYLACKQSRAIIDKLYKKCFPCQLGRRAVLFYPVTDTLYFEDEAAFKSFCRRNKPNKEFVRDVIPNLQNVIFGGRMSQDPGKIGNLQTYLKDGFGGDLNRLVLADLGIKEGENLKAELEDAWRNQGKTKFPTVATCTKKYIENAVQCVEYYTEY